MSLLSKKQLDQYIHNTGVIMALQENRATQYVMYAIQVDYKAYVGYHEDWEYKERADYDGVDYDEYEKTLCMRCRNYWEEHDEIPEDCLSINISGGRECDDEAFHYYNIEQKLTVESVGVFFTLVSCQAHIDANRHHYSNPQTYGISAWRNPEMQAIMQHLIEGAGEVVPSHYA